MKDSQRLDLYRQHIDTFRQWLGHEFPMVDHVLATLKETVDGGSLNAGTPRDMEFCTINGLREQLRRQASITTTEESAQAAYEWRIRSEGDWHPLYPSDIAMMCLLFGHDVRLAAPASPAASALSEDAILAIAIDHGLGTAVVESIAKALLAASTDGEKA